MAKKKENAVEVNFPEFGVILKDEDGVLLNLKSNSGMDKGLYLEQAKKLSRPISVSIESEIFDAYRFRTYALNTTEARQLASELVRMADYLESGVLY